MIRQYLIVAALALSCCSKPAGIAMGVDHPVLKNFKNLLVPFIVDEINQMKIKDMENDQGYVKDIKIQLEQLAPE